MQLEQITPLILTYNESVNIDRTLKKLNWAKKIIVIDSFSTDRTIDILNNYPQVEVFQRKFDTFANQCNYGLEQINSEWILSIDADYLVTDELLLEIKSLSNNSLINSYFVNFKYCVFSQPLRGTILPPRAILFRKNKGYYIDDGHAHQVIIEGKSEQLKSFIYHDDRKSLTRWLQAQDRYMVIEAKKLQETPVKELSFGDRLRKQKILAPFIILLYCLILKGGIFDGWRGFYYAFERVLAEMILSIRLIEYEQLQQEDV
jgi:glycosyltransferase involved in cell wall biosynthesis